MMVVCCAAGFKIPQIENLGVCEDLFECIDLSDNELLIIDNFPIMKRLVTPPPLCTLPARTSSSS
jgi:hypothetical protein